MKRKAVLAAVLCMLLMACIAASAVAGTFSDTSATSGIDVVILLDNTTSMSKEYKVGQNDPEYYRLDAAAMLIGMLDMEGSQVAVIPFASQPDSDNTIPLTSVQSTGTREAIISQIYQMKRVQPNTNIGTPILTAVKMLEERGDKKNAPMIVLLTDGGNDAGKDGITISNSLRWQNGELRNVGTESNVTTTKLDEITKEAVECAGTLGYPIYTIALNTNPELPIHKGAMTLSEISRQSGLENGCYHVKKDSVSELPGFFAQVLASKIGSSIQYAAQPVLVSQEDGNYTYEVIIPMLNRSVLETNIIIPATGRQEAKNKTSSGIDADSIEIYNAEGKRQSESDGVTKLASSSGHFAMVKIRESKNTGMWKLKFSSVKKLDSNAISFNILYNYSIKLQGNVSVAGRNTDLFYKSDVISFTATFVNEYGNKTTDEGLFTDYSGEIGFESWMNIAAAWKLYRTEDGEIIPDVIAQGNLDADAENLQYAGNIDLSAYGLKSGDYRLQLEVSGAGLMRDASSDLKLETHAPAVNQQGLYTLHVNTPGSGNEASYKTQTGEIALSDLVTDADGDTIRCSISGESSVIQLTQTENGFSYSTVTEDGRQAASKKDTNEVFTITYDDKDGGKGEFTLEFFVISDEDEALKAYTPVLTVEGTPAASGAADAYLKNTPVTISLQLRDGQGNPVSELNNGAFSVPVSSLASSLTIQKADGTEETPEFELVDGNTLVYTVKDTGNKADAWTILAKVGTFETQEKAVTVPNDNAPLAAADEAFDVNCGGERVPGFLSAFFGKNTDADSDALNIGVVARALFSDLDRDILSYSDPVFTAPDGTPAGAEKVSAVSDGSGNWKLSVNGSTTGLFHYTYTISAKITATDGDGLTADYVRTLTVTDLGNKMVTWILIIAAVIAILVILIAIIHQIRKPRFPKLALVIREEPSMFSNPNPSELSPVKTPTNANACGVDGDIAANHSISLKQLQNVIIYPIRSSNAVGVTCKLMESGHQVMLGDEVLKARRKYTWSVGQSLSIQNSSGSGSVNIQLEMPQQEDTDIFMNEQLSGEEWSSVDIASEKRSTGKRSRKVDRTVIQENPQDTGSSSSGDDFDF